MKLSLTPLKFNKGMSPIVAVLLLLAITSVVSVILYLYVLSVIGGLRYSIIEILAPYEDIMIDDLWYKNEELHVYVRNLSGGVITVSSVYVEDDGATVSAFTDLNIVVSSNDVIELRLRVALKEGSYLVRVTTIGGSIAEKRLIVWSEG